MVVFVQSGYIGAKLIVFGLSCIRAKVVVMGQSLLYSGKVVVFGQKWLYSGKVAVFGQSGCIW